MGNFLGMVFSPQKVGADFTLCGLVVWVLIEIKVGLGLTGGLSDYRFRDTHKKNTFRCAISDTAYGAAPEVESKANYMFSMVFFCGYSARYL